MADGLLGSFDNVMAGLTADELAALADPVDAPVTADAPVTTPSSDVVVDAPADPPVVAPHRVIDRRAREVADRLLRRPRSADHDSVAGPDRSRVTARLIVVDDSTEEADQAGRPGHQACSIDDGDTIVVGRGEVARQADPLQLLVPYGVVSRQHCLVSRHDDVVFLSDTGSANGTVIMRDAQIVAVGGEPVPMVNGDVVATAGGRRPFLRFEIHSTSHHTESAVP